MNKIMFHCINGTGIGHITRAVSLSKIIIKKYPKSKILIESNGRYKPKINDKRVRFYFLKYTNIDTHKNPHLKKHQDKEVGRVIKRFNPSVIVFDNQIPRFIFGKEYRYIKKVLVIRSLNEKFLLEIIDYYKELLDYIIIPHSFEELQFLYSKKTNALLKEIKNILIVGPIVRNEKINLKKARYDIIATLGGGGIHRKKGKFGEFWFDTEINAKRIINVFEDLFSSNRNLRFALICGPNFRNIKLRGLKVPGIKLIRRTEHPISLFKQSKIVISQLGYNTTMELLKYHVPAIFFAKKTSTESQETRGKWIEKNKYGIFLRDFNEESLKKTLIRMLESKKEIIKLKRNLSKYRSENYLNKFISLFENG